VKKLIVVVFVTFLLSGCGLNTPVKLSQVSTYAITSLKTPRVPRRSRTNYTLLVNTPIANPGYGTAKMIYINIPYKLRSFAENRWVASPARMLLPLIAQRIRRAGYFKAVVTPPFVGVSNYRIDTKLIKLQQEFIDPVSHIRLVIQADLINSKTNQVIVSRRFQVFLKATGNNPYAGVLATNKAAAIMANRINSFVLRNIS